MSGHDGHGDVTLGTLEMDLQKCVTWAGNRNQSPEVKLAGVLGGNR